MYEHILVPVDIEQMETSEKAVRTAVRIAQDYEATLHFLTVVAPLGSFASTFFPDGFSKEVSKAAREKLHAFTHSRNLDGLKVQHVVAHGAIYDQILSIAGKVNADLVVMASHRPELSDYLLGPNAARVVRHANCSVMVVRE
ncbi:universal stress protein [Pelagibius litoralis]|uniref:Universal stress protein n=1 Tax=Pelagibius litoralis TaxID=374515 RepID=A0A967F1A6_9PROT|nr:universal stress protein [Pelagibius litoralis]NIA71328.1 universal stress protein [Pelagibius litoralis]